jgi:hypothetical protein
MAIEKLEKTNGTYQLMNAVDNPIPFWATSHRDLGCPRATLPILDFRIPVQYLLMMKPLQCKLQKLMETHTYLDTINSVRT